MPVLWLIPCLENMFVSCKKLVSWCNSGHLECSGPVPVLDMSVVFGCVLVVFGCVSMCKYVSVCICLHCVVGLPQCWRRWVGCCVVVTVQKRKRKSVIPKNIPRENF